MLRDVLYYEFFDFGDTVSLQMAGNILTDMYPVHPYPSFGALSFDSDIASDYRCAYPNLGNGHAAIRYEVKLVRKEFCEDYGDCTSYANDTLLTPYTETIKYFP